MVDRSDWMKIVDQLDTTSIDDHVIVGRSGFVSLRARGVLAQGGAGA